LYYNSLKFYEHINIPAIFVHSQKGVAAAVNEESDVEDEEDIDFDEDDFEGTLLVLSVSLKQIL